MDDKPIKIDLLRRDKGLSVMELAERSGVGRRIIEDWIQKRCKTSNVYKLQKLAKVLELLEKMTKRTGLYALGCNLDPQAAMVAYNGMNGKE